MWLMFTGDAVEMQSNAKKAHQQQMLLQFCAGHCSPVGVCINAGKCIYDMFLPALLSLVGCLVCMAT